MKDDYENEVNPGLLEIIASNLEHLAKLLHGHSRPGKAIADPADWRYQSRRGERVVVVQTLATEGDDG